MNRLKNKTAVITGSSRGIGLAILRKFAEEGANIIACSSQETVEKKAMYAKIAQEMGVSIIGVYFDMSNDESVRKGVEEIKSLKQPVNILVNNAGMAYMGLFVFNKLDDIRKVFQVNYFSHLIMVQGLVGLLSKNRPSTIINTVSVAGIDGGIGVSAYGSTKAAMILLTKVLSQELMPMGIRVNAVAPGIIDTDLANQMGEKAKVAMIQSSAVKRIGSVQEVANTFLFLASDESSYINGQIIRVDGGIK